MIPRCCHVCGRWGNRGYVWDDEAEMWRCANEHACARRKGLHSR